jgi:hypothetical protein
MSTQIINFPNYYNQQNRNERDLYNILNYTYLGIITYSNEYNKEDIICQIIKNLVIGNRLGCVVSYDETSIVSKLNHSYEELVNKISYLKYNQLDLLFQSVNCAIIIDDVNSFNLYLENFLESVDNSYTRDENLKNFYATINNNNNYIILITEFNCDYDTLNNIIPTPDNKIFVNKPFFLTIGDKIKLPTFEFHPVKLTQQQKDKIGDHLNDKEITDENFELLKYFNITFPSKINELIKSILSDPDNNNPLNISELFRIFKISDLLQYGPKYRKLYENLCKNHSDRHVILCKDEEYYGSDFINQLILNFDKDDTIDLKPIHIYNSLQEGYITNLTQEFNTKNDTEYFHKVLITTTEIPSYFEDEEMIKIISAKDVKHFHILEPDFVKVKNMINTLFSKNNYTNNIDIKIHLYYSYTEKNNKNLDQNIYETFYHKLRKTYLFYEERFESGYKLKFDQSQNAFIVIDE